MTDFVPSIRVTPNERAAKILEEIRSGAYSFGRPTSHRREFIGFIYLVRDSRGYYKIGRTEDVKKRVSAITSHNSGEITLVYSFKTNQVRKVEKFLHQRFVHVRLYARREWFALSNEDVAWIQKLGIHKTKR